MTDVTRILSQIESGDPSAAALLLPLVYEQYNNSPPQNPVIFCLVFTCPFSH
jgi:hypothetical protein